MDARLRRRLEMAVRVRDFLRAHRTDGVAEGAALTRLEELVQRAEVLAAQQLDGDGQRAPHELLSDREFEVMRRLGSGLTVSQIATELAISAKTVSTYRTRILGKMAVETNAELVRYAARYGLIG